MPDGPAASFARSIAGKPSRTVVADIVFLMKLRLPFCSRLDFDDAESPFNFLRYDKAFESTYRCAVEAGNAFRWIDELRFQVDGFGFTDLLAGPAGRAALGIDPMSKNSPPCRYGKQSTDGAEGVAVQPATDPAHGVQNCYRRRTDDNGDPPELNRIGRDIDGKLPEDQADKVNQRKYQ